MTRDPAHGPGSGSTEGPGPGSGPGSTEGPGSAEVDAIRAAFPRLTWRHAERIDEGWDHIVVICRDCGGPDALGHRDLVFRFPTDEHAHERLPHEVVILDHVSRHVDAAIPRYTHVPDDVRAPGGAVFAGYPLVRGDRLTPERFHALPAGERAAVAAQLGSLLSALHALDTAAPALDAVPTPHQPENLDFVRRMMVTEMPRVLTPDELADVRAICHEVAALQATDLPQVFLHYDIGVRHLYWERSAAARGSSTPAGVPTGAPAPGRLGLIDFSDMCLGDPAVDFAELYAYGPRLIEDVLAHYVGHVDPTFLDRAWAYQRLAGLYMISGHLFYGEETWADARETFDRCRSPLRPRA